MKFIKKIFAIKYQKLKSLKTILNLRIYHQKIEDNLCYYYYFNIIFFFRFSEKSDYVKLA